MEYRSFVVAVGNIYTKGQYCIIWGQEMQVNEIFKTIMGESTYSGIPCAIVRLSGCNLNCRYCDTQYHADVAFDISTEVIVNTVKQYNVNTVLITGGEPLLQPGTPHLAKQLVKNDFTTIIETNGTQLIENVPGIRIVDVKTPSSGHEESFNLANIPNLQHDDEIKFVISNRDDFDWSVRFVDECLTNFTGEVIFSPNMSVLKPSKLADWVLENNRIRLGVQFHKLIWGMNTKK